jgi:hypothetical protein
MKLAVVVEIIPLTFEIRLKEFVFVATVKMLLVPAFMIACKSVLVAMPFMLEISIVPEAIS